MRYRETKTKNISINCPITGEDVTVKCKVLVNEIGQQQEAIEELLTKIEACNGSEFGNCDDKCKMTLMRIIGG